MAENDLLFALKRSLLSGEAEDCEAFIRLAQPIIALSVLRELNRYNRLNRETVDDLVQETFVRLYQNNSAALRRVRAPDSAALAAWLRAVAGSVVLDWIRSILAKKKGEGKKLQSIDDLAHLLPGPDNVLRKIESDAFYEQVERCLEGEKERDRAIFRLHHKQELTARAISEIHPSGLSCKGVETILRRVALAVRQCLEGMNPEGNLR